MLTLTEGTLTKAQLSKLDRKSLSAFLGSAKLYNEIRIATNHMQIALKSAKSDNDAERDASIALLSYTTRILAGHLHEASVFIHKHIHAKDLKTSNYPKVDARIADKLKSFKKHFSKSNAITEIRQKLSFHTDVNLLLSVFHSTLNTFQVNIYLNRQALDKGDVLFNLFGGADSLSVGSILFVPSSQPSAGVGRVTSHIMELAALAAQALEIFFFAALAICEKHFKEESIAEQTIELDALHDLAELTLPYFFTNSEANK